MHLLTLMPASQKHHESQHQQELCCSCYTRHSESIFGFNGNCQQYDVFIFSFKLKLHQYKVLSENITAKLKIVAYHLSSAQTERYQPLHDPNQELEHNRI